MALASVSAAVDIANLALQRLGQPTISTLTEVSRDANIVNQLYNQNRDYCLMLTDWDCLVKRQVLDKASSVAMTGATAADPVVVTCTGHVFINNQLVYIESVTGMTQLNGNTYRIWDSTSLAITLYDTDGTTTNGSGYTAWTSGGVVRRAPGADWGYVYDLPTDCLRVLKVLDSEFGYDDSYKWKKEKTFIHTDISNAGISYIKQESDPSLYEPDLVEVIAARLTWLVSMRIHADKTLRREIYQELQAAMARARITNAAGAESTDEPETPWVKAW